MSPLGLVEEIRIGSRSDPDVGFSRLRSQGAVAIADDDVIYVIDAADFRIRVYDGEGRLVRRFGGRGDGPGEFQSSPRIGIWADTVWVLESGISSRYISLFTLEGEFIAGAHSESVRVPLFERELAVVTPQHVGGDGVFWGFSTATAWANSDNIDARGTDTVLVPRVRFDLRGSVLDTIGWDPEVRRPDRSPPASVEVDGFRYPAHLVSDAPIQVLTREGRIEITRRVAEASATKGVVGLYVYGLSGELMVVECMLYEPRPYDDIVLGRIASHRSRTLMMPSPIGYYYTQSSLGADSSYVIQRIKEGLEGGRFQPPVQGHWLGTDGSLWLRREDHGTEDVTWVIIDGCGVPWGAVTLPRSANPVWTTGSKLWTIERDDVDVPWIVRYGMPSQRATPADTRPRC